MYNILIINNDNPLLNNIEEILTGYGHHVDSLDSGSQVIHGFNEKKYDLVVIDFFMQGIFDANSIARHIRIRNGNRTRIIGVSDIPKLMEKTDFDYIFENTPQTLGSLSLVINESLRINS